MMSRGNIILTTSPQSQPAKKPRRTSNLTTRPRPLYGRKRHHHTVKERDSETGLYYYGARYLDGRTGRWISGDPAMGEYVPEAPVDDEARKRNGSLPGMGGVFNYVNLHVYHYAGNNPVKLVDPDGRQVRNKYIKQTSYTLSAEAIRGLKNSMLSEMAFPRESVGTAIVDALDLTFLTPNIPLSFLGSVLGIKGFANNLDKQNNLKVIANLNTLVEDDSYISKLKSGEYSVVVTETKEETTIGYFLIKNKIENSRYRFTLTDSNTGETILELGTFYGNIRNIEQIGTPVLPQIRSAD